MADDAKHDGLGAGSGQTDGNDPSVSRVFHILNGQVSIGDTDIPLASPQIELGSTDQRRVVCLSMTAEHAKRFQEAWQRLVHSMSQAGGKYLVSDFNPSATPDVRYKSEVRRYSHVKYCDTSHARVTYAELRLGGATRVDIEYTEVAYVDASHHEVTYSAAFGKRLIAGNLLETETLIPITIRGDSRHGNRRVIVQVDGIEEVQVRRSLAGPDLVDVVFQLATTLPIAKLIWLIESE